MKVFVTELLDPKAMEYLASFAEIRLASSQKEADQILEVVGCDAIISRGVRMFESVVEAGAKSGLKLIVRHAAGLDTVNIPHATELGIAVCNCPGANARSTAEQAVSLAIAISKNIRNIDNAYRNGAFTKGKSLASRKTELGFINHEVYGKTVGIAGCGRIGRIVAEIMANGFGTKILGYDPFAYGKFELPGNGKWCENLDDMLKESDFVFTLAPLTKDTYHMIGKHELETMKPSAFLINDGRGELIDEEALYEALRTNVIAGAAIDMLEIEPPVERSPLFDLYNIIVTPHCGSATFEATERLSMMAVENVKQFMEGGEPEGWVNKAAIKG